MPSQSPANYSKELSQSQLPVLHRIVTIHAVVITFQVIAWLAVGFRIYCRTVLARSFGYDDFFVLLSLAVTTVGTALVANATKYGLGQHFAWVVANDRLIIGWYKACFFFTLSYFAAAGLIKISILFQYLRLFLNAKSPKPRIVSICFIALSAIWAALFFFIQLFSCAPISAAWGADANTNCQLLYTWNVHAFLAGLAAHSLTNMLLDYSILLLPFFFRHHLDLAEHGRKALIALFVIGGCVATISVVRLAILLKTNGAIYPTEDATWNGASIMIFSAVEIQAAVICASVPIFWPIIAQVFHMEEIHVVHEVTLQSEARTINPGMRGWKRHSDGSATELQDLTHNGSQNLALPDTADMYKDPYITGWQLTEDNLPDSDVGNHTKIDAVHTHKTPASRHEKDDPSDIP